MCIGQIEIACPRWSFLFACLSTLIAMSIARGEDSTSKYLKGVNVMTYDGFIAGDEGHCAIRWQAFLREMDFVANQSTKLKLITHVEHIKQIESINNVKEMLNKPISTWTAEDWRQWDNEIEIRDRFIRVPHLSVVITTVELESGCAAVIKGEAKTRLKPSAMISTGTPVRHPDYSIWSKTWTLKAPYQSFSRIALERTAEMMKSFVNDWTNSQNLP
jgi:hypothetical protein